MLTGIVKRVQGRFRRFLWRLLGVSWSNANWIFRRQYLSDANWVVRGPHSYDNGALVWRWSEKEHLTIGKYCSIAFGVQFLCGGGHHHKELVSTFPLFLHLFAKDEIITFQGRTQSRLEWNKELAYSKGSIIVGNDVWIGQNAMILSGVTIGDGAIILAGSMVSKDVEPYSIMGGVPAKLVAYRFEDSIIKKLLKIAWWDWPEAVIKERLSDFFDPNTFIARYG